MAQEDYNLDMNIDDVELSYLLLEAMMQHMAPDTPPIHVTSDRRVQNLIKICKTHNVRLCVSSRGKMRIVNDANIDGKQACEDVNEVSDEGKEDDDDK